MRFTHQQLHGLGDAEQNFEQLEAKAILDFAYGIVRGTAAFTWAGTSIDGNVTVTHGLGRTPVLVSVPNFVIPGSRSWQCFGGTYTSTTFALLARPDGVFTGTVNFPWVAIG